MKSYEDRKTVFCLMKIESRIERGRRVEKESERLKRRVPSQEKGYNRN